MAKTTAVDMNRLRALVHEGKSVKEIMQEMNIKDIDPVSNALEEVMQEKGMKKGDSGLVGKASIHPWYTDEARPPPSLDQSTRGTGSIRSR